MTHEAERLGEAVKARRAALGLTQYDVWRAGGPSNTTQTIIENGEMVKLTRGTARKIDAGMRWQPGSAKAVFTLGLPPVETATPGLTAADARWVQGQRELAAVIRAAQVDEATKARLLDVLGDAVG